MSMSIVPQPTAGDSSAFADGGLQSRPLLLFITGNPVYEPPPRQNLQNVQPPFIPDNYFYEAPPWQNLENIPLPCPPFIPANHVYELPLWQSLQNLHLSRPAAAATGVVIRQVWAHNLEAEFNLIRDALVHHRCAAIDTEFPGVVFRSPALPSLQTPEERYATLRSNVNALKLLQLGLTLSDEDGHLPGLGQQGCGGAGFVWEFNFRGFDPSHDPHAPESVEMLRNQGMDLDALNTRGVDLGRFAELMKISGLAMNNSSVMWIGFQNAYDLGFLLKTLLGRELPPTLPEFHGQIQFYLSRFVFDVKYMMKFCRRELFGGLEKVAAKLGVKRTVGKHHHAGSDSLLTLGIFRKMYESYFAYDDGIWPHMGYLYGLDTF